jgi:hypothetical protein
MYDWGRGRSQFSGCIDSTRDNGSGILRSSMSLDATTKAVLIGHLAITAPVVVLTLGVPYLLLYQFGPMLMPYYILSGLAISWQWYLIAARYWEESLAKQNLQQSEIEALVLRNGLRWPGASAVGSFALHTAVAAICAVNLGPWLVFHWFGWVLPLSGFSTATPATNYYLQHLELVSIIPALIVGYFLARRFQRLATSAWILPTITLAYKLWTFRDQHVSVLVSNPWSGFSYYFVIERVMPTFQTLYGSDPIRVAAQMFFVAPFYAGVAYSFGALLSNRRILERLSGRALPIEAGLRESPRSTEEIGDGGGEAPAQEHS